MTILIVDDQSSVIDGLLSSIGFERLGFDTVLTAADADSAISLLQKHEVHILMSDIEMPGKDGLEMNAIIREQYPDVLRILLTSHAKFVYAQKGLKLGCFDYLVQPVPYSDIEATLVRAVVQYQINQKSQRMRKLGTVFDSHRTEFLNNALLSIFSQSAKNRENGLKTLRESGYPIGETSFAKLMLVDVHSLQGGKVDPASVNEVIMTDKTAILSVRLPASIHFLIGKNRYDRLVILFFSEENIYFSTAQLEELYHLLGNSLHSEIALYVGWTTQIRDIREAVERLHKEYQNNISQHSELIYVHRETNVERIPTSMDGFLERWDMLLRTNRQGLLCRDIFSYLDQNLSSSTSGFSDLCELHQRLTQLFFKYFYENGIDIVSLFNDEMSYETFMYSCNTVESEKKAVQFLINALSHHVQNKTENLEPGYVERAKTYIMENVGQCLTVKDVADYVCLNPEYFTRLFKKETGSNIKDFIIECKLSAAKDYLVNSNLPISMVAMELNYSNFSHFTQMFKRFEGVTPKEYRALHRHDLDGASE